MLCIVRGRNAARFTTVVMSEAVMRMVVMSKSVLTFPLNVRFVIKVTILHQRCYIPSVCVCACEFAVSMLA